MATVYPLLISQYGECFSILDELIAETSDGSKYAPPTKPEGLGKISADLGPAMMGELEGAIGDGDVSGPNGIDLGRLCKAPPRNPHSTNGSTRPMAVKSGHKRPRVMPATKAMSKFQAAALAPRSQPKQPPAKKARSTPAVALTGGAAVTAVASQPTLGKAHAAPKMQAAPPAIFEEVAPVAGDFSIVNLKQRLASLKEKAAVLAKAKVRTPRQVELEQRVAELSRRVSKQILKRTQQPEPSTAKAGTTPVPPAAAKASAAAAAVTVTAKTAAKAAPLVFAAKAAEAVPHPLPVQQAAPSPEESQQPAGDVAVEVIATPPEEAESAPEEAAEAPDVAAGSIAAAAVEQEVQVVEDGEDAEDDTDLMASLQNAFGSVPKEDDEEAEPFTIDSFGE
mmetsp:Transcript_41136/g.94627  ORF Transcript_41136/g.94627 Transcript_41136/m.94627 type:complete len:394 (-) Transcript_41136:47-1228(-)